MVYNRHLINKCCVSHIRQLCSRRLLKTYWQTCEITPYMRVTSLKRVENIAAKGEIARHEQFLLLQQCFQKSSDANFAGSRLQVGKG